MDFVEWNGQEVCVRERERERYLTVEHRTELKAPQQGCEYLGRKRKKNSSMLARANDLRATERPL